MRRSKANKQSGQALIELAVVLPILLLLALGVIELGRYAYIAILVGNAAHAGAAWGAQSNGDANNLAGITKAADYDFAGASTTASANGQPVSKLTVTSSFACGCDSGGTVTTEPCSDATVCSATAHWVVTLSVTASGQFSSLFSYPGIPSPITITRTATLPVI